MIIDTHSETRGASPLAAAPPPGLRLDRDLVQRLRCPACSSPLEHGNGILRCDESLCKREFPLSAGRPVLIDRAQSVFDIDDILRHADQGQLKPKGWGARLPTLTGNVQAEPNLRQFARELQRKSGVATVLVVGGGQAGAGFQALYEESSIRCVETDIYLSSTTRLACDGHNIPFANATFDGVVVQAVLEHVLDPIRVVSEIHRVLKPEGLVYAETPFMQQVHLGAHDFTRYTHLGHRRLFRYFREISSGAVGGPGTALAWSLQHFLRSAGRGPAWLKVATAASRLSLFWLKYLDAWLLRNPAGVDAACAFFFLGQRSGEPLADHELVRSYRGAQK